MSKPPLNKGILDTRKDYVAFKEADRYADSIYNIEECNSDNSCAQRKFMHEKKILITGGMGFIGSDFIRLMLDHYPDNEYVNFDKLTYAGNPENLKDIENQDNYQFGNQLNTHLFFQSGELAQRLWVWLFG